MKKIFSLLFITAIFSFAVNAQDFKITFAASGASSLIDSIQISNINQNTFLTINGDDTLHLVNFAGIDNFNSAEGKINFFPNPVNEKGTLELMFNRSQNINIDIYGIDGSFISGLNADAKAGHNCFDILNLSNGIFIIKVSSPEWAGSIKLIAINENINDNTQIKKGSCSNLASITQIFKSSAVQMQYNSGDTLEMTAYSGTLISTEDLVATQDELIDFNFVGTPSLSTPDSNVKQYQVIPLTCKYVTFNDTVYQGTFGSDNIDVFVVDDTLLTFIIPQCGQGNFDLNINIEGNNFNIPYAVDSLPNIVDPVAYYSSFITQLNFPTSDTLFDDINDSLAFYTNEFNNLSFSEQLTAVYVIDANREIIDEINAITADHMAKTNCNSQTWIPYVRCKILDFVYCVTKLTIVVSGTALIFSLPSFGLGAPAGGVIGLGITLVAMKGTYKEIGKIWYDIAVFTFHTIEAQLNSAKATDYFNNSPRSIDLNIKARNIQNTQYSQGWISSCVSKFNTMKTLWNNIFDDQIDFSPLIESTMDADNMGFLSLNILTNSQNVSGTLSGTVDNIEVEFSTSQTTDQAFSYCITYDDGEFSVNSDTIDAMLLIPTITGTWDKYSGTSNSYTTQINHPTYGLITFDFDSIPETFGLHTVSSNISSSSCPTPFNESYQVNQLKYTLTLNSNGTYSVLDSMYAGTSSINFTTCSASTNPMAGPYTEIETGTWSTNGSVLTLNETYPSSTTHEYTIVAMTGIYLELRLFNPSINYIEIIRFNKQ